jgi:hypothetical protein
VELSEHCVAIRPDDDVHRWTLADRKPQVITRTRNHERAGTWLRDEEAKQHAYAPLVPDSLVERAEGLLQAWGCSLNVLSSGRSYQPVSQTVNER